MSRRFVGHLDGLRRSLAKDANTIWEAFVQFSKDELGVEPETLVKVWFEPLLPEMQYLKSVRAKRSPEGEESEGLIDEVTLERYTALLTNAWTEALRDLWP